MDIGQIASAVGSLKAAGDIAVGLINLRTMAEVQAKAVELNQKIIAAQHDIFAANATQTALIERVRELEKKIADMETWDTEKKRYKMVAPYPGATVYAVQKAMDNGEPPHYLCTNCFKKGYPSILQIAVDKSGFTSFACQVCRTEARTGYRGSPRPKYAEEITQPE